MTDDEIKAARHRATELRGFDKFDPPSSKDTDDAADLLSAALDDIERLREALVTARYPCAVAASYVEDKTITIGLRMHAESCVAALRTIDAALETRGQAPMEAEPEMRCTGSLVHDEYTRCPVHDR